MGGFEEHDEIWGVLTLSGEEDSDEAAGEGGLGGGEAGREVLLARPQRRRGGDGERSRDLTMTEIERAHATARGLGSDSSLGLGD